MTKAREIQSRSRIWRVFLIGGFREQDTKSWTKPVYKSECRGTSREIDADTTPNQFPPKAKTPENTAPVLSLIHSRPPTNQLIRSTISTLSCFFSSFFLYSLENSNANDELHVPILANTRYLPHGQVPWRFGQWNVQSHLQIRHPWTQHGLVWHYQCFRCVPKLG